jgi:hypothetical protein
MPLTVPDFERIIDNFEKIAVLDHDQSKINVTRRYEEINSDQPKIIPLDLLEAIYEKVNFPLVLNLVIIVLENRKRAT